jgi:hypothetical protein
VKLDDGEVLSKPSLAYQCEWVANPRRSKKLLKTVTYLEGLVALVRSVLVRAFWREL